MRVSCLAPPSSDSLKAGWTKQSKISLVGTFGVDITQYTFFIVIPVLPQHSTPSQWLLLL